MKNVFFILSTLLLLSFISCQDRKTPDRSVLNNFQQGLTSTDSISVIHLSDSCMAYLKNNLLENAIEMLYEYDDTLNQIIPLSESKRSIYLRKFMQFPVYNYNLVYFSFNEEGLNDIKYEVTFSPNNSKTLKTSYMFNPVKVSGKWYLCIKNSMQSFDEINR